MPNSAALKLVTVHPREKIVVAILTAWLLFQPWAIGGLKVWAQFVSLALAAGAFAVALPSRRTDDGLGVLHPVRLVVRSPFFWLGVALFGYVAVQALNPAWTWKRSATHWWLEPATAIRWLPSGVDAPFAEMNGWRALTIWGSPFLAGLAVWAGVMRRQSLQWLLTIFIVNAVAVAALGLAQRVTGTDKLFWVIPSTAGFASFSYRNHAAAYLLVALALTFGLAMRHHLHALNHLRRSHRAPLYLLFALAIGAALFASHSRSGLVAGAALALGLAVAYAMLLWRRGALRVGVLVFFGTLALGVGGWLVMLASQSGTVRRLAELRTEQGAASFMVRVLGAEMARQMFVEHPAFGVGAGGYRHLELRYGSSYPALGVDVRFFYDATVDIRRFRMNDAHNDHLQLLAELGLVGAAFVYALLAAGLAALTARHRRAHPLALAQLAALLLLLALAVFDFPFLNPAVLSAAVFTAVVTARWCDLESFAHDA